MKFTITPLGGARRDTARVVDAIVRYLQPPPEVCSPGNPEGPSRYYADSAEEPGRWLGAGARQAGLVGAVTREDFAQVLSGRDPTTGERLISAQGSAGRRPKLGAGAHTVVGPDEELWFGEADAAAALGVTRVELSRMLDVGTTVAVSKLVQIPGWVPGSVPGRVPARVPEMGSDQPEGSFLVPVVAANGSRWVTEAELSACLDARANGIDPAVVSRAGAAGDELPLREAARLAGVTAQYLRRLAKRWEDNRDAIERTLAAGRTPRQGFLVARRGERGQWLVERRELVAFLERRRPPAVRVGFDLTLTTEKSLGVLALLGGPDAAVEVLGAIAAGNDWAMRWLEQHAAAGRVGGESVAAAGWTVASFRHLTSRALDPFPHHHNVVANTVTLPDGTHRALDARGLYRHTRAASALATAEMRHQLSTRFGVRWRPAAKGGWEIDGIDDHVLAEFSTRRGEIDDALRELEDAIGRGAHPGEVDHIVLRTRPDKRHTPVAALLDDWQARAARCGFDPVAAAACHSRDVQVDEPDTETLFASLAAPEGICRDTSVFTRGEAIAALANHPVPGDSGDQPLLCGAARLEQLADEFLASPHVIALGGDEPRFTTVEILGVQDRIMRRFSKGLHHGASLANPDALAAAFESHLHLSDEQRALVTSWCTSGHRFQTAIGRAGAGKTTSVAAAVAAWEASGYQVMGGAVKGEAARTLAAATGIECETVAWYLAHDDPLTSPLDARTVLVIDEASTLGDRDLDRLMWLTATTGATLRLIGDPAQHGSIAAGGMYRVICEHHDRHTPELVTTHRVRDPHDRAAAEALREGRIDEAFDHLEAAGHLHVVDDELDMYRQMLTRWWDAHLQGHDHPMVDRRNATRRQLNRLAHQLLQANGEVGTDEIIASDDRRFSVGDRVTARLPNRVLHPVGAPRSYVRNGATGTITALTHGEQRADDTITIAFDDVGEIAVPRGFFDDHGEPGRHDAGIDHAYALTSYAIQGATHAVSTSRIDPTAGRAETYVDITRGRSANHLYLTAQATGLDSEIVGPIAPRSPEDTVAERLRVAAHAPVAWDVINSDERLPQPACLSGVSR